MKLKDLASRVLDRVSSSVSLAARRGLDAGLGAMLTTRLFAVAASRDPDKIIGGSTGDPYLLRWYLIPRNRWLNLYLHKFLRSDTDRALHDHPWHNCSIVLDGSYKEVTPEGVYLRVAHDVVFRKPTDLHRVELFFGGRAPVWTLFITGPMVQEWGFMCPKGKKHWKDFSDFYTGGDGSNIGPGCDDS